MLESLADVFLFTVYFVRINFNTILNIFIAIGTIGAAVAAYNASQTALQIHKESEKKRDEDKEIEKVEQELSFLKGINAEFLGIQEGLFSIFKMIANMHDKYLDENNNPIEDRCNNIIYCYTNRDYFTYYEKNADKIGIVSNEVLRNNLVEFYISVKILLDCLKMHRKEHSSFDKVQELADINGELSERERKILVSAIRGIEYQVPQIRKEKQKIESIYNDSLEILEKEIKNIENKLNMLIEERE